MKREVSDGVPVAAVARKYGVSRQSVYNVLKAPKATTSPPRPSKLDPFKGYVADRLSEFDLPATVLLREIKELGYGGGISILKEFVREQKSGGPQNLGRPLRWEAVRFPKGVNHEEEASESLARVQG